MAPPALREVLAHTTAVGPRRACSVPPELPHAPPLPPGSSRQGSGLRGTKPRAEQEVRWKVGGSQPEAPRRGASPPCWQDCPLPVLPQQGPLCLWSPDPVLGQGHPQGLPCPNPSSALVPGAWDLFCNPSAQPPASWVLWLGLALSRPHVLSRLPAGGRSPGGWWTGQGRGSAHCPSPRGGRPWDLPTLCSRCELG